MGRSLEAARCLRQRAAEETLASLGAADLRAIVQRPDAALRRVARHEPLAIKSK